MRVGCFDTIRASTLGQIVEAKITNHSCTVVARALPPWDRVTFGALDALDAFHQGQPVLVGLFPTLRQRIEPASPHFPTGLVAELGAEPLECGRRRNDDPALPACLHHQLGQMGEPIILNGLRQKGACQFGCGTFAERTEK